MSIKSFYTELKKGLKAPAYLLSAEDQSLLKEALFEIRRLVPEEERDFKYHAFDLESPDGTPPLEQIIDILNTVPFMGGRQVVTIENLQKLKAAQMKPLVDYLASPSPDSVLAGTYAGKPRKTMVDKLKGAKHIAVGILDRDLPFWVKERAAQKGVELTNDAIEFLIGTVGAEPGLLSSEIEKFAAYGSGRLSKDDISAMVTGGGDHSPFDLVDALRAGNAERAFRIYSVLSETQEAYSLLGVLNWHYGRINMSAEKRAEVFGLLNNADLLVKSTGGAYPLEHLLARLLRA